jgi:hypothetical protein
VLLRGLVLIQQSTMSKTRVRSHSSFPILPFLLLPSTRAQLRRLRWHCLVLVRILHLQGNRNSEVRCCLWPTCAPCFACKATLVTGVHFPFTCLTCTPCHDCKAASIYCYFRDQHVRHVIPVRQPTCTFLLPIINMHATSSHLAFLPFLTCRSASILICLCIWIITCVLLCSVLSCLIAIHFLRPRWHSSTLSRYHCLISHRLTCAL